MLDDGSSQGDYDDDGKKIWRGYGPVKPSEATGAPGVDSLQPVTGWFMYEVESEEDVNKRRQELDDKRTELKSIKRIPNMNPDDRERWHKLYCEVEQLESF